MKPFAHTAALVGSRFLLLVFLLLVALAQPARAQVPQQGCGNENETPCPPEKVTVPLGPPLLPFLPPPTKDVTINSSCDTGLQPSLQQCGGCQIFLPFFGCVLHQLCFRCTNLSRRLGSVDPFLGGWTDWALKNQRELAQDEPLNWVTQISTHNSYNTWADGHALIDFPNQIYSTTDQLRLGARAITFDNYYLGGFLPGADASAHPIVVPIDFFGARLCHSAYNAIKDNPGGSLVLAQELCVAQVPNIFYPGLPSMRYYSNGIKEVRNWLDQNPNEIVIVDFEEYVPQMGAPADVDEAVLAPIRAYLGDMVLTPPPHVPPASVTGSIASASFIGLISTGVLTVSKVLSGTLHVGDQINGASIPPGTFIQSFDKVSATDGTGTYNLNQASLTVVSSETITTGVLTVTAVGSGKLHVDDQITGTNIPPDIPPGTFIQSFGKVSADGTGTYNLNQTSVTGSITNGVLTVTALISGALYAGDQITGTGIPDGTVIQSYGDHLLCPFDNDGTSGPFGVGCYVLSNSKASLTDVLSETITTAPLTVPSETITTTTAPFSGRFPDRWPTRREMLAAGKRVIILDNAYDSFSFAKQQNPQQPSEFLFNQDDTVAGSYGDGTWLAKNQRRYDSTKPKACFQDTRLPTKDFHGFTDFDVDFHKALFTKATTVVEERELGEFVGVSVAPKSQVDFGLMKDQDIVDATKCNYSIITLDKYSQELVPPDGSLPPPQPPLNLPNLDYLIYTLKPDFHRQALAVWSWNVNDRGQNGDCAMLEGSSQRWASAKCGNSQVQAKFACARPRSQSGKDPLQWEDPLGEDWRVTSVASSWDDGPSKCLAEFGKDGFVFSVPVNGYQNQRLKDAALYPPLGTANDNIWLNYRQHGDGRWVIPSSPAPVAIAGPNQVVECGNSVNLDAGGSHSPGGGPLSYKWQGPFGIRTTQVVNLATPGDLPLGVDPILLAVTDSNGQTGTDSLTVTVQDTTPPVIRSVVANPNSSWPPNHKMFPVHLSLDAIDACDPNFVCHVVSVTSNEGTSADWQIVGPADVMLRSERSGNGDGRVYTILIQCTDASGNASTRAVTVTIPHDQGKSKP